MKLCWPFAGTGNVTARAGGLEGRVLTAPFPSPFLFVGAYVLCCVALPHVLRLQFGASCVRCDAKRRSRHRSRSHARQR